MALARKKVSQKSNGGHAADNSSKEISAPMPEIAIEASEDASSATFAEVEEKPAEVLPQETSFPIVGIGASAGGLAAFEAFFENMPTDSETGISFVLVQHLDPGHKSILTELVRRYTRMSVYEVEDGVNVEPDCTYIIPPNKDMGIRNGQLFLVEPAAPRGLRLPIDFFFRSLAQDRGEQAICIVLSGTGTDGTLGLKAIKEAGGMVMVQESESATYDGMPRSAIATGLADYILPVMDMPRQLISYVQSTFGQKKRPPVVQPQDLSSWIQRILVLLRSHSGHDFSNYKQNTIRRRIERRMVVHQIERMEQYLLYLRQNPNEVETLFRELLIGVTGFFRDPEAFEALRDKIIPQLANEKSNDHAIRVWAPGCSTGEEAYSIAILLVEALEKVGKATNVQIFATDIDHEAIERARSGIYPTSIAADVAPEQLAHFFTQEDDFYHINKSIRDLVVFAEQDLIKDPPFSKIDLVSCRNLLIYWEHALQKKIFPLLHYSLKPGGFLFLGSSETIGDFANLFEPVDRKWKIYRRREGIIPNPAVIEIPVISSGLYPRQSGEGQKEKKSNIREVTEKMLIHDYAPPSVMVNARGDIVYVYGHTGKYLELPVGEINTNLMRSAREGLRLEIATALRKAVAHGEIVRYEGLEVKTNGVAQEINLVVRPVNHPAVEPGMFLVVFEDVQPRPKSETPETKASEVVHANKDRQIVNLERELRNKDEYLQTTVEELETANEELKSTNEELQSTNEELQSTNEELETSKEELQSINEELVTVNTELQKKIDEQSQLNNDMNNLLAGTGIGTVFVDNQMHILRFTPAITRVINLIQTDIGRPLSHIASNLVEYENLEKDTQAVLNTLVPCEMEVQARNGLWFLMHILPYRTFENVIEGAVITFVEITEQKKFQHTLSENERILKSVVENSGALIWSIDADSRLIVGNSLFYEKMGEWYHHELKLGEKMPAEWLPQPQYDEWKARYQRALDGESFKEEIATSDAGELTAYEYAFKPIWEGKDHVRGVSCNGRDVSDRKRISEALRHLAAVKHDASDAIVLHDLKGVILDWNPAAVKLFGWSEAEARLKSILEMVPGEERGKAAKFLKQMQKGEVVAPLDIRFVNRAGKTFKVHLTGSTLVGDSGKPYAATITLQEIN